MPTPSERFTSLFDRTHAALLSYALRRVTEPADAADVVAETFLIAWRGLDQVPTGDSERPWLFGVVRKVLANTNRSTRRRYAPVIAGGPESVLSCFGYDFTTKKFGTQCYVLKPAQATLARP